VWRGGKNRRIAVKTEELPAGEKQAHANGPAPPKEPLGLSLQSLTPSLADRLGLDAKAHGALVVGVTEGSPAGEAGLREGDLIVEVDRRPIASAPEAARALTAARLGGHL